MVCILDGFGENPHKDKFNAVHSAKTPCYDSLGELKSPEGKDRNRLVQAHGHAVGLPSKDDMGNSEVGHNALGAGKIYAQGAKLVDMNLASGQIWKDDGWNFLAESFLNGGTLHMIGLLTEGGVHARYNQLAQLIEQAAKQGAKRIRLHVLTDGRDVPDGSSIQYMERLEQDLAAAEAKYGCSARVASGGGRMYVTMDRYEADWGIVQRGWEAHVLGEAPNKFKSGLEAVTELRKAEGAVGEDQFLRPFVVVGDDGNPLGMVQDNDAVLIFNFRSDRMIELSKAFEYPDFDKFDRKRYPKGLKFVGMIQYDGDLKLPERYLVPPPSISKTSGEYLVKNGLSTFAVSETQKFGHVTFFWNGNRSGYLDAKLETYLEIKSDKCVFNEKPLMKAQEIYEAGAEALKSGRYDMVRINFANPDMVGHTGDLEATKECCAFCDQKVQQLIDLVNELGGAWLVTSDHGNADDMVQRTKQGEPKFDKETGKALPLTSHTLAPTRVAFGGPAVPASARMRDDLPNAGLANITATYINLLGFEAPEDYEPSLITCD